MGQISDSFRNQYLSNNASLGDLFCSKCNSHLLLELIQLKEEIMLRRHCFCGTLTTYINDDIKFLITPQNFYQGYRCHQEMILFDNVNPYIKKYCVECDSFICEDCFKKHEHKNIIDANNYAFNCLYHRDNKIIGFCRTCKISFCKKCIINKIHHERHDIIYMDELKEISDKVKTYELNLKSAFDKLDELIKYKYGKKYNIKEANLFAPQKISPEFENEDKEIILCLELLKTFLDIYIYKQKNNILNYQSIAHILKHYDFEIIILKHKMKKPRALSSRIISIGSDNYEKEAQNENQSDDCEEEEEEEDEEEEEKNVNQIDNNYNNLFGQIKNIFKGEPEITNNLIKICLKMNLKDKEKIKNEINIDSEEIVYQSNLNGIKKVIKLRNGDLAVGSETQIEFISNFKVIGKTRIEEYIKDFDELDNGNICILKTNYMHYTNDVIIYQKNIYEKIKVINLYVNNPLHQANAELNKYYKIKSISGNNIALLSFVSELKSNLTFLSYSDYKKKELKLLDVEYEGDMVQMDNFIIICFGLLDSCLVYFYDIIKASLESVNIENPQTYKKSVKCFKLKENNILISTVHTGIIFNIKTRQTITFIYDFKNIDILVDVGKYQLVCKNNIISQINFRTGRLYNKYKFNFAKNRFAERYNILNIIDVGNNKFCVSLYENSIFMLNYN